MEKSGDMFDVIVVGAGIMGSSAAYQAAKRGKKTLLLEQFDFLHHRGSSHGESRTIRATYPEEYYSTMVLESEKLWEEAQSEMGYRVYFRTSQLDVGPIQDKSLQAAISNCQKHGIPHRVLDRRQVDEEFSGRVKLPENWFGLLTGHGGIVKPTKAVCMYQTLALKHGAVLKDHTEVVDFVKDDVEGGVRVITKSDDEFWGKKCVVTAGAWMRKLIKKVSGLELPIQPLETTVYYWKVKEGHEMEFSFTNGFPSFASYGEPYIYGTPVLEFPGLIKVAVHGGRPIDPDKRTWKTSPMLLDATRKWLQARFGGLVDTKEAVGMQSCMYSLTPDEDFVIDYLGGVFGKNVVVGGGFSGHGFKMAPVVGKMLADLAVCDNGEAKDEKFKHFKIARFLENAKGNLKGFADQVNLDREIASKL